MKKIFRFPVAPAPRPRAFWLLLGFQLLGLVLLPINNAYGQTSQPDNTPLLDVDIGLFDPNVPKDAAKHRSAGIQPLVRQAESRYLPFVLLQTLNARGEWGVVRVRAMAGNQAPQNSPAGLAHNVTETEFSPLLITGVIEQSDGEYLRLTIRAVDSTNREWLNQQYSAMAVEENYEQTKQDPFQGLFNRIAADLQNVKATLSAAQIQAINEIAVLRYGARLSPATFTEYLTQDESGLLQLTRLPSKQDPMLQRVLKIRQYEYLFIDTENDQYQRLFTQMKNKYTLWRQYRREMAIYLRQEEAAAKDQKYPFQRGTLPSMKHVYGDYVWFRTQEQYINELSQGFNNEVLPTVLEVNDSLVTLSGDLDAKYEQWQSILQSLFELERGEIAN
ncbi:hypothetical protein [Halioxenophilus aromaticivorans]|uniref:Uncharacterized protein n=1 Tax=Halioxenophilus aromaticivorans TaxID=1306992 RepID=A0AAV3U160_9ALTE